METIIKLQRCVSKYLADKSISLEDIRTKRVDNPFPVGFNSLFKLIKKSELSLKQQSKLIEFFGFEHELMMYDYEF